MRSFVTLFMVLGFVSILGALVSAQDVTPTLSDEFNNTYTLRNWAISTNPNEDLINIDSSSAGQLAWIPTDVLNNAWFQTYDSPFRYKLISGNFFAEIYVNAGNVNDPSQPPTGEYNSAGFLARDPASDTGAEIENWLMFNLGNQSNGLATESKSTLNNSSILTLIPTQSQSGRLALCRAGDEFRMYRWLDDEAEWTLRHTYTRADLPNTIQLGLVVNAWRDGDLYAEFDYFRVDQTITIPADCEPKISAPTAVTLHTTQSTNPIRSVWLILAITTLFIFTRAITNSKRVK